MNIIAKKLDILKEKADLWAFGVYAGRQNFIGSLKAADKILGGLLSDAAAEEGWGGGLGEIFAVHTHAKVPANRIAVVGLGEKKNFTDDAARHAAAALVRYAEKIEAKKIVLEPFGGSSSFGAHCEGAYLGDYAFLRYKTAEGRKREKRGLVEMVMAMKSSSDERTAEKRIAMAEMMCRATVYARDLVNEPGNMLTPKHLVEHAKALAKDCPEITLKVFDRDECEKMGMGAFLAVAKGSEELPYFIHLVYRPESGGSGKKIALVGKGVTFDSGGLSLKPSAAMQTMKGDMAGAAAVLGAFSVLPDLGVKAEVHGLIAACENMPSGKAYKVDDILTAFNGKTIEIFHTDAEGRLTLADAMGYAVKKINPDIMVDIASLTGACEMALGEEIGGLMTESDKLAAKLAEASRKSGEPLWRLPMYPGYAERIRGEQADLRDMPSTRWGEEITAAFFLREFARPSVWAHIDMGGAGFVPYDRRPHMPKGATGYGARLLLEWLKGA